MVQKGLTLHNLGRHEEALECYKKAEKLNSGNEETKYYIGFLMLQLNDVATARQYMEDVISRNINISMACYYLAKILREQGEVKEAKILINKRIRDLYPVVDINLIMAMGENKRIGNIQKREHHDEVFVYC